MGNPLLGQILATALGSRLGMGASPSAGGVNAGNPGGGLGSGLGGGLAGGLGGAALGGLLAGMVGRGGRPGSNRGMLLAMMLPLAMRWVQQHGGLAAVLDRFRQSGLGQQADSWVSTGQNHALSPDDVRRVVGSDEIAKFASQLGVGEDQVTQGLSEILPELTDKLTPQGSVPAHADQALETGQTELQKALGELSASTQTLS